MTFPLPPEENVRSCRHSISDEQKQDVSPFQMNFDSFFIYTAPSSLHPVLLSFCASLHQQQLLSCRAIRWSLLDFIRSSGPEAACYSSDCRMRSTRRDTLCPAAPVSLQPKSSPQTRHGSSGDKWNRGLLFCCLYQLSAWKRKSEEWPSAKQEEGLSWWLWTLQKNLFIKYLQNLWMD